MDGKMRQATKRAVLVSLTERNGVAPVSLHDVVSNNETDWRKDGLVTSKEYPQQTPLDLAMDDEELANFGSYILARLVAGVEAGR